MYLSLKTLCYCLSSVFAFMLISPSAFAYLDPGTGSIILQGIIGAVAVGMATMRLWWYKLKSLFSSGESVDEEDHISEEGQPPEESQK